MYVCMYVCMYVMYVCNVCIYVCMYVCRIPSLGTAAHSLQACMLCAPSKVLPMLCVCWGGSPQRSTSAWCCGFDSAWSWPCLESILLGPRCRPFFIGASAPPCCTDAQLLYCAQSIFDPDTPSCFRAGC